MPKLTDKQIVDIVNTEFDDGLGGPGGEIALERAEAYDYYLQKQFGNEEEDEVSRVVTSDVADVVDSIMPSLLRIFTTADNLVSFDAVGPEDEAAAQQESDYVNYIFFKRNPAFELLYFAFFDALVQKSGIWKAWWDESEEVTTETYEGLTEIELLMLLVDEELEIVERSETIGKSIDETGAEVDMVLHDVEFRRVVKTGRVRVECVPPEEYRASNDNTSMNPSAGRMSGHEREVTRDELLAMGFSKTKVAELSVGDKGISSPEEDSRKDKSDDQKDSANSADKSQDKFVLREAYIKIDADGDGRAELMQVFSVNTTILQKEPADRQPFHMVCPAPLPHKHIGRSTADKVMDIQLVNSTILRQTLGNLYHSNNPGHGVWEQGLGENTMDDLLTTKVGRVARFSRPVNESYQPIVVPFTADASFPMLQYFDKAKRDRTGISSDSEGLSPEALKNIQTTVLAQSVDLSKMKVEQIARIFAETGLKSLFRHISELVRKHQQKTEVVKLRNQWVPVNPAEWRERADMTVNIGLGIGTREQNLVHLNAIWEKQTQMVEGGGMNLTVTPRNIFNTAAEIVKNANLKMPEMFFTDPGNKQAPPPSDIQQELEKARNDIEQRQQQLDAERQQIAGAKLQMQQQEMTLDHKREMLKLEIQNADRQVQTQLEVRKLQDDAQARQQKLLVDAEEAKFQRAEAIAKIAKLNAEAAQIRSETASEPEAGDPRIADAELQKVATEIEKQQATIIKTEAEIQRINADIEKTRAETRAQDIENEATEAGITDLVNDLAAEDSESDEDDDG